MAAMRKKDDDLKDFVIVMLKLFAAFGALVVYVTIIGMLLANIPFLGLLAIVGSGAGIFMWLKNR